MFRLIYILIIVLPGCFASNSIIGETNKKPVPSTTTQHNLSLDNDELGSVITLRVEHPTKYGNLELRLINVEDSRCPIGTECIWAGQIVVTLEISNEHGEKKDVKLLRKRVPKIANAFGYGLTLLDVEPHPKKGKNIQISDQVIKLKIVKEI